MSIVSGMLKPIPSPFERKTIEVIVLKLHGKPVSREYFTTDSVQQGNYRWIYGRYFDRAIDYANYLIDSRDDDGTQSWTSAEILTIKYVEFGMRKCPAWCYYVSCLPDCEVPYGYDRTRLQEFAKMHIQKVDHAFGSKIR